MLLGYLAPPTEFSVLYSYYSYIYIYIPLLRIHLSEFFFQTCSKLVYTFTGYNSAYIQQQIHQ